MLRAIFYSWIMYFGPMEILAFDQEGGITTDLAALMCERFNISRSLGGSQGHGAAPLAERRLAIVKLASLKADRNCKRQGAVADHNLIVADATMVTNHMLVYNGYTPSMALTGSQPRELYDPENTGLTAVSRSLETQPDMVETMSAYASS